MVILTGAGTLTGSCSYYHSVTLCTHIEMFGSDFSTNNNIVLFFFLLIFARSLQDPWTFNTVSSFVYLFYFSVNYSFIWDTKKQLKSKNIVHKLLQNSV